MKPILPLFAIAALSAGVSLLPRASAETALGAPVLDDESELDQRMLIVKAQVRTLRRSLRDAEKNPDSLAALHALQAAALEAKLMTPRTAAAVPEGERAAFVQAYRKDMVIFLEGALATERHVLEGDLEAAGEAFKALRALEDPGHERYTEDG